VAASKGVIDKLDFRESVEIPMAVWVVAESKEKWQTILMTSPARTTFLIDVSACPRYLTLEIVFGLTP